MAVPPSYCGCTYIDDGHLQVVAFEYRHELDAFVELLREVGAIFVASYPLTIDQWRSMTPAFRTGWPYLTGNDRRYDDD